MEEIKTIKEKTIELIGILFLVMSILCVIGIVPYIIEVLSNINANNLSKI